MNLKTLSSLMIFFFLENNLENGIRNNLILMSPLDFYFHIEFQCFQ